jgi:uncharacterized membrane protein YdfJ with MMPL/SSD domain
MFKILLHRRRHRLLAIAGWLAVAGLLPLVAACAAEGSAGNSDAKNNNGFYGSIIGGR